MTPKRANAVIIVAAWRSGPFRIRRNIRGRSVGGIGPRLRAGHQPPPRVHIGLLRSEWADDSTAVHDHQSVAEKEEFLQVLRDEQYTGASLPCLEQGALGGARALGAP